VGTFDVTVHDLAGSDRDRIFERQAQLYLATPTTKALNGTRTIPVLRLTRIEQRGPQRRT
jgi:hypothetical protein